MSAAANATIERAMDGDLAVVLTLLGEVGLPTEGVAEHFDEFLVARDGDRAEKLIGCVGQERYGDVALLRSLAVSPGLQHGGLGKALAARLIEEALAAGVSDIVLLTTTARDFFAHYFGFVETERGQFDEAFADSPEWRLPRCASAACMHLQLFKQARR